jgi:hypothetical protein
MLPMEYYWIHNPTNLEKLGIQEKLGGLLYVTRHCDGTIR